MKYILLTLEEAHKRGYSDHGTAFNEHYEYEYRNGVFLVNDDETLIRYVASDGGEPEDQTLDRDYNWILGELNEALKAGKKS